MNITRHILEERVLPQRTKSLSVRPYGFSRFLPLVCLDLSALHYYAAEAILATQRKFETCDHDICWGFCVVLKDRQSSAMRTSPPALTRINCARHSLSSGPKQKQEILGKHMNQTEMYAP